MQTDRLVSAQAEVGLTGEARYRILFEPVVRSENSLEHPGYDHLFSDDPIPEAVLRYDAVQSHVNAANVQHDLYVNGTTREIAVQRLLNAVVTDTNLEHLIGQQAGRVDLGDPLAVIDALRVDPELRLAVGTYLLLKLDRIAATHPDLLPEKVVVNGVKRPDHQAYQLADMTDREYAARIALARLDGSFNPNREQDSVAYGENGKLRAGRHRAAADVLLDVSPAELGLGFEESEQPVATDAQMEEAEATAVPSSYSEEMQFTLGDAKSLNGRLQQDANEASPELTDGLDSPGPNWSDPAPHIDERADVTPTVAVNSRRTRAVHVVKSRAHKLRRFVANRRRR